LCVKINPNWEFRPIGTQYFETWNDFLRADMTRKDTFKQGTSLDE
jgi:hypothetical protein